MSDITRKHRRRSLLVAACVAASAVTGLAACSQSGSATAGAPTTVGDAPTPEHSSTTRVTSTLHMITNADHRLAFHVYAGHLPAIVLDAGGGQDSSYWTSIAPELAEKTGSMVVTYDRAGMGKSDEVPGPWKVQDAVSDLKTGLTRLGITHDVVLVSHSQAGEIATYLADEVPGLLSGAVLTDASLPEFYTSTEIERVAAASRTQLAALKNKPPTRQTRQLQATAADYVPMHRAYHKMSWPQSVPATVIVSSATPFDTASDAAKWRDAARSFVAAAPNRTYVTATKSSHDIATDRPGLVLAQIEKMVSAVS